MIKRKHELRGFSSPEKATKEQKKANGGDMMKKHDIMNVKKGPKVNTKG